MRGTYFDPTTVVEVTRSEWERLQELERWHDDLLGELADLLGAWLIEDDVAIDALVSDAVKRITEAHPQPPCVDPAACVPGDRCWSCGRKEEVAARG